jgi:hypothetical protein
MEGSIRFPDIFLEGLRKIMKNFSHDSRSPGRGFNRGEAGELQSRPRSVWPTERRKGWYPIAGGNKTTGDKRQFTAAMFDI